MAASPRPYSSDEMYNGDNPLLRNLHDDVNKFYREVMKLNAPLKQNDLPRCREVINAIMNMTKDNKMNTILLNIRATPQKNLWPLASQVPGNTIGGLWKAVQDAVPGGKVEELKN